MQPNKNNIFIDVWHPSPLPAVAPWLGQGGGAGWGWGRGYAALYCYCYGFVMNIPNCLWSSLHYNIITLHRTGPYNSVGGAHALLITPCLVIVMLHIINTLSTADLGQGTPGNIAHRNTGPQPGTENWCQTSKGLLSYEAIRKLFVTFSLLARPIVCALVR